MATYIVRVHKNMALVGICSAPNVAQLFLQVDEITNPFGCEYLKMPSGCGVFFDGEFRKELTETAEEEAAACGEEVDHEDPENYVERLYPDASVNKEEPVDVSDSMYSLMQDAQWTAFTVTDFCKAFKVSQVELENSPAIQARLANIGLALPSP